MSSYRLGKERGFGRREIGHESTLSTAYKSIPCACFSLCARWLFLQTTLPMLLRCTRIPPQLHTSQVKQLEIPAVVEAGFVTISASLLSDISTAAVREGPGAGALLSGPCTTRGQVDPETRHAVFLPSLLCVASAQWL